MNNSPQSTVVAQLNEIERAQFYKKTYAHVAGAVLAFIGFEYILFNFFEAQVLSLMNLMISSQYSWLIVLGVFWLGSSMADRFAHNPSRQKQYLGLGLYVALEGIIFLPLIYFAMASAGTEVITQAAVITLFLFAGLSAVVFLTNTNFSFLRTALVIGSFIAIGLIVAGSIFGFNLGLWFSVGMVAIAAIAILYQTSKVKYEYTNDQYVGASLGIFASLMLLFYYILSILSRD